MAVNHMGGLMSSNYMFMRSNNTTDMGMGGYTDKLEKRQLFLRSYQFSRKKSMAERIKGSFFRVKRVICARLRSARKLRKVVWLRLRYGLFYNTRRRKFFLRLNSNKNHYYNHGSSGLSWPSSSTSSCFWRGTMNLHVFSRLGKISRWRQISRWRLGKRKQIK